MFCSGRGRCLSGRWRRPVDAGLHAPDVAGADPLIADLRPGGLEKGRHLPPGVTGLAQPIDSLPGDVPRAWVAFGAGRLFRLRAPECDGFSGGGDQVAIPPESFQGIDNALKQHDPFRALFPLAILGKPHEFGSWSNESMTNCRETEKKNPFNFRDWGCNSRGKRAFCSGMSVSSTSDGPVSLAEYVGRLAKGFLDSHRPKVARRMTITIFDDGDGVNQVESDEGARRKRRGKFV